MTVSRRVKVVFDSWEAFVARAETVGAGEPPRANDADDWTGYASFDRAAEFARTGWAEGRAKTGKLSDLIRLELPDRPAWATEYATSGAYPDVARYLGGEPEHMVGFVPSSDKGPRVFHIVVQANASSRTSGESLTLRGAACLALVDAIEAQGNQVELDLVYCSSSSSSRDSKLTHQVWVPVKRPGYSLSPDLLSFALVHPATYRRLAFGVRGSEPSEVRDFFGFTKNGGYGVTVPVPAADLEGVDLYVGGERSFDYRSIEDAWAYVSGCAYKAGILSVGGGRS